jgi:hypothetical protein
MIEAIRVKKLELCAAPIENVSVGTMIKYVNNFKKYASKIHTIFSILILVTMPSTVRAVIIRLNARKITAILVEYGGVLTMLWKTD